MKDSNASLLAVLKNTSASMHRVEKIIARTILQKPQEVLGMTVARLAQKTGVADSSIIRFCRTLGFDSYIQMKLKLAAELSEPEELIFEDLKTDDDARTIFSKIFAANIRTLEETFKAIDFRGVNKAVKILCSAKKICFFGIGSSAPVAQDAYYRFMRIGLPAYAETDPHIGLVAASMMDKKSAAVGISHSGRTQATIRELEMAKSRGAAVIGITSSLGSPITEIADIILTDLSNESKNMKEAISARIGHIAILDCLFTCTAMRFHDQSVEKTESLIALLDELRIN
jgi:DNA-binding MurR/RpiR family transcriptional regulator